MTAWFTRPNAPLLYRKPKLDPSKMIVECWEYFLFGSHVYVGSLEVDLSHQKYGRADISKMTVDFKDPDRPSKSIGACIHQKPCMSFA